MGMEGTTAKPLATPRVKKSDEHEERRRDEPVLGRQDTILYRSNVMRASFLAQDRADLCEAVKALARHMAKPRI
eukprot:8791310-Heterocapsa_arctica.AAC.1